MLESWLYTAVFFHGTLDPMIDYFYDSSSFVWWSFQACGALLIIIAVFFSRQLLSKKWTYTLKKLASEYQHLSLLLGYCHCTAFRLTTMDSMDGIPHHFRRSIYL